MAYNDFTKVKKNTYIAVVRKQDNKLFWIYGTIKVSLVTSKTMKKVTIEGKDGTFECVIDATKHDIDMEGGWKLESDVKKTKPEFISEVPTKTKKRPSQQVVKNNKKIKKQKNSKVSSEESFVLEELTMADTTPVATPDETPSSMDNVVTIPVDTTPVDTTPVDTTPVDTTPVDTPSSMDNVVSAPMDAVEKRLNNLEADNRDLKQKVCNLETSFNAFETSLRDVKVIQDRLSQYIENLQKRQAEFTKDTLATVLQVEIDRFKYPRNIGIEYQKMTEKEKGRVYPCLEKGKVTIRHAGWGTSNLCCRMYSWENGKPTCDAATLYKLVNKDVKVKNEIEGNEEPKKKESLVVFDGNFNEIPDGDTVWWLFCRNEKIVSYNVVLTRETRYMEIEEAINHVSQHMICRACVRETHNRYFIAGTTERFCQICCTLPENKNGKKGVVDQQVSVCEGCMSRCMGDNLGFALEVLKGLFPLNKVAIDKKTFSFETKNVTPDNFVTFKVPGIDAKFYIIIEVDGKQHDGETPDTEIKKMKTIKSAIKVIDPLSKVFFIRYSPDGKFKNRLDQEVEQGLTRAQRIVVIRQWVIWYMATCIEMNGNVPEFILLYAWFNSSSAKISASINEFGVDHVGKTYGYPSGGVWKYYTVYPEEMRKQKKDKAWEFMQTGCRAEEVSEVFPAYRKWI
jgi:hypothetical protein